MPIGLIACLVLGVLIGALARTYLEHPRTLKDALSAVVVLALLSAIVFVGLDSGFWVGARVLDPNAGGLVEALLYGGYALAFLYAAAAMYRRTLKLISFGR